MLLTRETPCTSHFWTHIFYWVWKYLPYVIIGWNLLLFLFNVLKTIITILHTIVQIRNMHKPLQKRKTPIFDEPLRLIYIVSHKKKFMLILKIPQKLSNWHHFYLLNSPHINMKKNPMWSITRAFTLRVFCTRTKVYMPKKFHSFHWSRAEVPTVCFHRKDHILKDVASKIPT